VKVPSRKDPRLEVKPPLLLSFFFILLSFFFILLSFFFILLSFFVILLSPFSSFSPTSFVSVPSFFLLLCELSSYLLRLTYVELKLL
jgi:hypothetical protein